VTQVSLSKITPPQLTNTLPRPRLLNLFKKNTDKRLILILGQAAQGKSTLAASFLEQVPFPSAWVNLGPEESDPVNLFQALVRSLEQALSGGDWSSLVDFPSRTMGPRDPIGFYREWIRGLAGFISAPVYLALDGLDRLVSNSLAFSFLQVLLDESPPELRLVLSSRQTPPAVFNYQPLKIQQQALVLNNEDLAFTRAEVRDFFSRTRKITLKAETLDKIQQATEGWIGGLILMAEILGRDLASDPDRFLGDGFLTRFRAEAFEYLGREIFDAQPPEVRDMLIRASLVPVVDPELLRRLTGGIDTEAVLREFAHRNLFVQGIYEPDKGWVFRFHQLFREFLLNRFQETFSEEERTALYRRAASLLEKRGELEAAGTLYLQTSDFTALSRIIRRIGMDLFDQGRTEDLAKLLGALPEALLQEDPWLLLLLSLLCRWKESQQNVDRLPKCLALFEQAEDTRGTGLTCAYLIEAFMMLGAGWSSVAKYLEKAEGWIASPRSNSFPLEKAFLRLQVGLAYCLRDNTRKGCQFLRDAALQARAFNQPIIEASALTHSLGALTFLGEFQQAQEVSQTLRELMQSIPEVEPQAWYLIEALWLPILFDGNGQEAREGITQAKKVVLENGILYLCLPLQFYELVILEFFGHHLEVQIKGRELIAFGNSLGYNFFGGLALDVMGTALYLAGHYQEARELLAQAEAAVSSDAGYSIGHLLGARLVLSLTDRHLGIEEAVVERLEAVLKYTGEIGHFLYHAQAHLALALVVWDRGEKSKATRHLQAGFQAANEKGFHYFPFINSQDTVRIGLLAFELEVTEAYDLTRELLTNRYAEQATPELLKLVSHPSPRMRSLGSEMLRIIHHRQVPFLEIRTLGALEITRGGTSVGEESWDRLQPKRLLLALLSHPGGKVSKETLMDGLWPGEMTDKAENNFKVTLMRLRKSLETDIHPTFGSSYIHLHNNLVFLDPEFTRTDSDEFLKQVDKGNWKERAQDARGAMEEYGRALEYYRGDFLPLETSLSAVDRRRDELKKTFIETLLRLAKLSEKQGSLKKAAGHSRRVLEADPLQEEACQAFMRLCLTLGNYNEALRSFETLKKNLHQELKSQPDPQTQALYNQIREKAAP
jgi:ATP/maltotriose-dependent transcriptional regulator MalT/DNA-binding SARP family transcriptional activator